jgi:hypothetical protein
MSNREYERVLQAAETQALPVHIGRDMHCCSEDCHADIVRSAKMHPELEAQAIDSDLCSASQIYIAGKLQRSACCIHNGTVDTSKLDSVHSAAQPAEHVGPG